MPNSLWSEIKVEIPTAFGEIIAEIFHEEGAGGVVYEDPAIIKARSYQDDEYLGAEVLAATPEKFGIKAYFPVDDALGERLDRLRERLGGILGYRPVFNLLRIREEEWAEAWKAYFKPERIGKVVIKPSWEEYSPENGELVVELDPGMAFGTGTHPTTRLCIRLLQEIAFGKNTMLDLGTGSGILGLAGAKLGITRILAADIDPLAVKVAAENVRRNHLETVIEVIEGELSKIQPDIIFDLVVANIISDVILKIIPDFHRVLKPGGFFLASGIIAARSSEVITAMAGHGLTVVKTISEQDWIGILAILRG